jgi:hypothetical protein
MEKVEKKFKSYIAQNRHTPAFGEARGKTSKAALASVKRKYKKDWRDYVLWTVYVHDNGEEERV